MKVIRLFRNRHSTQLRKRSYAKITILVVRVRISYNSMSTSCLGNDRLGEASRKRGIMNHPSSLLGHFEDLNPLGKSEGDHYNKMANLL